MYFHDTIMMRSDKLARIPYTCTMYKYKCTVNLNAKMLHLHTAAARPHLWVCRGRVLVERAVQLPEPVTDLHLSVCTHHSLPSKHHQPELSHVLLYHLYRLLVHLLSEVDAVHFHSKQRKWSDVVRSVTVAADERTLSSYIRRHFAADVPVIATCEGSLVLCFQQMPEI